MNFSQRQILIIAGAAFLVFVLIVLVFFNLRAGTSQTTALKVWGFDNRDVWDSLIKSYKQLRPNVDVQYQQVDENNYENFLLNALAAGQGPDVFPIHNRWLPKEKDKLAPVSPTQFTLSQLRQLFPTIVEQDFTFSTSSPNSAQIYALPLYIDTLALFYNKDLFDQTSIVQPPQTWDEFQADVQKLRVLNPSGQITRAGAAIGGTQKTIKTAIDILNVLMLQNGTAMTNGNSAAFASSDTTNPGLAAFNFYLRFSNAASPYYIWNDNQPDSLESFASGKTAMLLDYHSRLAAIRSKNPFLNLGIAALPQPIGSTLNVSYADYWGLAASKQSPVSSWAWDFIIYATTQPASARAYLQATGKPAALRSLLAENLNDPELGIFAKQALTARSWYEADEDKINDIFNNAISSVLAGQLTPDRALRQAQDQVSQLMTQN